MPRYLKECPENSTPHPPSQTDTRDQDALSHLLNWVLQYRFAVLLVISILGVVGLSIATFAQEDVTLESLAEQVALPQGDINVVWILAASTLVVFMNAGFGMLEVGMCRQKNIALLCA